MNRSLLPLLLLTLLAPAHSETTGSDGAQLEPVESKASHGEGAPVETGTLLQQITEAYTTLKSYRTSYEMYDGDEPSPSIKGDLLFGRRNKLRLSVKQGGRSTFKVSDGRNLYEQISPTTYVASPASKDISTIRDILQASVPYGAVVLGGLFATGELPDIAGPFKSVPGGQFNRLVAHRASQSQSTTVLLDFEPETHLLARAEISYRSGKRQLSNRTVFHKTRRDVTIPYGTFTFRPPAGLKLVSVDEAEMFYDRRLQPGARPFFFETRDLKGQLQGPQKHEGQVLLLEFWSTSCGPCVKMTPILRQIYGKYHTRGFQILGISLDEDKKVLENFLKKAKVSWPQIYSGKNWEDPIALQYGVEATPCSILIGRDGRIISVNPKINTLDKAVEAALLAR